MKKKYLKRFLVMIILFFLCIASCTTQIELINYTISTGSSSSKVIAVQLTDFHFKPKNYINAPTNEKLKEINPDILLLTGDIVDNPDTLAEFDKFLDYWDFIPFKFAVLGNHEKGGRMGNPGDLEKLKDIYAKHNIILLVNDIYPLRIKGHYLLISGLDDYLFGDPQWHSEFIDIAAVNLVLLHEPVLYNIIVDSIKSQNPRYCLVLAGHTHGGQIRFGKKPLYLPPGSGEYLDGLYHQKGIPLIVSKGLGTSSLYIRIGANPDLTVIIIE